MNCPNCGAPLDVAGPGSYLYCHHCSSLFFPKESQDRVDVVGVESEPGRGTRFVVDLPLGTAATARP